METFAETGGSIAKVINLGGGKILATSNLGTPSTNEPKVKTYDATKYASWGSDNLRPKRLIEAVEKNDLIPVIISFKKRLVYSQGLAYGYELIDENGNEKLIRVEIDEIEDFLEMICVDRYLTEAADDNALFNNGFVWFNKNLGGKIIGLGSLDSSYCRLELQNDKGQIENCYVNANWADGGTESDSEIIKALNPYYDLAGQIKNSRKTQMILPLRTQRRNRVYYDKADWEGLLDSGWLDLAQKIPDFKKSLMENQLSIKWHVQIPEYYWPFRFPNWKDMKTDERKQKMDTVLNEFTNFVKGTDKAGTALISTFRFNEGQMKEYPGWKVEALKGDFKGGEYIEDSKEVDHHIVRAFGLPAQLIQSVAANGQGAGSGSDIRVAFNQAVIMEKPNQDRLIQPLQIISAVNGWSEKYKSKLKGKKLRFWCKSYQLATLDNVTQDKRGNGTI